MANQKFEEIINTISHIILGKDQQIRLALTCLFAKGHLLIEDIPGIGKTTLAKALSLSLGLAFQRIQCTSDMLPADILGTSIFDQTNASFVFYPGPIFTHVLLADEINRTTPKTQSALLEAMEENQVTVEGKTRALSSPFFVIATQNPLEHFGTFPLPESQLDRFLMRIKLGYPERTAENLLLKTEEGKKMLTQLDACLKIDEVAAIQKEITLVHVSDALLEYLQDIIDFTRASSHFYIGLSPRAGIGMLQAVKSWAFLHGRDYALPEDLQQVAPWVVGHRLRKANDLEEMPHDKLTQMLMEIPVP